MSSSAGGALRSAATALLLIVVGAAPWAGVTAQQPAPEASPAPPEAAPVATAADVAETAKLAEAELDALVSPIALYPDALLAQIFVAATYPLDVVKAARWTEKNKELAQDARAAAAEAEGWDPSIAVLAAGFPQVIGKMAADLDQTELLGDALLTQSDDVLAAVQRMRARADALGNLPSNDAQTVTVEGDNIAIAPTSPEVVYVPTYDSQAVYTQTASAPPVVVAPTSSEFSSGTVYTEDDDDTGELLATGLLSFGAGMLVSEIFEDDNDWGGYWGPAYGGPIGWGGGGYVRPYPPGYRGNDVNIGNDINIDRDGDSVRVDRDGNWQPSEDRRRDEAQNRISDRHGTGDGARRTTGDDARRTDLRQQLDAKGGGAQGREQLLSAGGGAALAAGAGAGMGRAAQRRPAERQTAISDRSSGLTGANRAADRGRQSAERAGIQRQDTARQSGRQETARGGSRSQQVQRGGSQPQAQRSSGGRSAFNQGSGGRNAASAGSRGTKSRGGGGRGGGGRGGGGGGGRRG